MKDWALVTGASRGIGAAIAETLAAAGHPVILNFRTNETAAQGVRARIEAAGGRAELARFDIGDAVDTRRALDQLLEDERPIGVLVNNAGVAADAPFPAMQATDWQRVTRTSLDGFFNVTQPLVMPMVRRRRGRIITLSSVSGLIGNRGQTNYAAAKAGLIGATRSLAQELAKRHVTVNAVAPGLIETDMTKNLPTDDLKRLIPMRRLGRPDEVASLVRYLASEEAGYITGQVISINGGLS